MEKITRKGLYDLGFKEVLYNGQPVFVNKNAKIVDNGMFYLICDTSFGEILVPKNSVLTTIDDVKEYLKQSQKWE